MSAPCDKTCPECGGNGFIGGDTSAPWICTIWARREFRKHYEPALSEHQSLPLRGE